MLDTNRRSAVKLTSILQAYYDLADRAGSPAQAGLFGETSPPTPAEILSAALRITEGAADETTSLFDRAPEGGRPSGATGQRTTRGPLADRAYASRGFGSYRDIAAYADRGNQSPDVKRAFKAAARLMHPDLQNQSDPNPFSHFT